jgi:hypothetical protein
MKALTKGQYEVLAGELRLELIKYREHQDMDGYSERYRAVWELCHRFVVLFKESDPEFKRELFLKQCGVTE